MLLGLGMKGVANAAGLLLTTFDDQLPIVTPTYTGSSVDNCRGVGAGASTSGFYMDAYAGQEGRRYWIQ